ncbi:hypothetical protein F503_01639 [Ophiostoma piceae UAMH 11346]|uniref:Protein kinase domain-containing protein n=1 Tax=Ophiostoma piceae (strain UAMH 11346) TaxID=1262450 RepID=S3C9L3_OPHP1|nr:hypothetical protein F503_01639 [Ophiostoma piceae UAMH 11346]
MDVYSLGLTLANCLRGKPLGALNYVTEKTNGINEKIPAEWTASTWADECRKLLTHPDHADLGPTVHTMLERPPETRPSAQKLKEHIDTYLRQNEDKHGCGDLPTEEVARRCVPSTSENLQPTAPPVQNSPHFINTHSDIGSLVPFHLTVNSSPTVPEANGSAEVIEVLADALAPRAQISSNRSSHDGNPPSSHGSSKTARFKGRMRGLGPKWLPTRNKSK